MDKKSIVSDKTKNTLIIIGAVFLGTLILVIAFTLLYLCAFTDRVIKLDTATIISVVLAFFSIWISIRFYMKATETSNKFYDTSYSHMKEQSVLLGRIEERFGEKFKTVEVILNSLAGMKNNLDSFSQSVEEVGVKSVEKAKAVIVSSNIKQEEKDLLLEQLSQKDAVIEDYKSKTDKMSIEIGELMHQINQIKRNNFDSRYFKTVVQEEAYKDARGIITMVLREFDFDRSLIVNSHKRVRSIVAETKSKREFFSEIPALVANYLETRGNISGEIVENIYRRLKEELNS